MKKFLPILSFIMAAMAAIPVLSNYNIFSQYFHSSIQPASAVIISRNYPIPDTISFTDISDGKTVTRSAKSVLYSLVGAVCEKDFTADEVKALCIAIHTQLCIENERGTLSINTKDKNVFLSDSELKNKFSAEHTALCSYCDNVYSTLILYDGKPVPVYTLPFCTSKESPCTPIANPYDALYDPYFSGESYGITPTLAKLMAQQGLSYSEILNYCCSVSEINN